MSRLARSQGGITKFTYQGADVVLEDNDGTQTKYLNGLGIDNKLRVQTGSSVNYFLSDHLGSTTALTDATGQITASNSYDSFGNASNAAFPSRYQFTGREYDSFTGLTNFRARWLDPKLGRFISADPIGLSGGINQFAYVGNNSINAIDPSGLYESDVHYYLTYFLAQKTGCFNNDEARLIADADQGTDEDPDTAPGPGITEKQRHQNADFHALTYGNSEGVGSAVLRNEALRGGVNYVGLGRSLHFLQDTFSHDGFESDTWGHSPVAGLTGHKWGTHGTDKTSYDIEKTMRMVGATWKALNEFAALKKCGCRGRFDSSWWNIARDFASLPGGDDYSMYANTIEDNDPMYLERKRLVLGVPRR